MNHSEIIHPYFPKTWLSWWEQWANQKPPVQLKKAILELSTHYQKANVTTPWESSSQKLAYLCYFMPLNQLRLWATLNRLQQLQFRNSASHIIELGSGPGTSLYALAHHPYFKNTWASYDGIETSKVARELHHQFEGHLKAHGEFSGKNPQLNLWSELPNQNNLSQSLLIMQTSLNEFEHWPDWIFEAQEILLIEAGHRLKARISISLREQALQRGFNVLAPCTHQETCPLANSKKDWCHDRFDLLEIDLPTEVKNAWPFERINLSFSYLYLSRQLKPIQQGSMRVIGDPLIEKGKTKQMVCRSSRREFVSWLKRQKNSLDLSRGAIVDSNKLIFEEKGNELRLAKMIAIN